MIHSSSLIINGQHSPVNSPLVGRLADSAVGFTKSFEVNVASCRDVGSVGFLQRPQLLGMNEADDL